MIKGLYWTGPLEKYKPIITENPIEEIWHLIDFFTSEEIISQRFTPPIKKGIIPFVTESIAQAEEFRYSANLCGEHTKPLQLYYCLHNLTKAVLALRNNGVSSGYHGIKKVEIAPTKELLNISAQIDKGLFWDLLKLKKIAPKENLKVTFDELLKRCLYIVFEYTTVYNRKPDIFGIDVRCNIKLTEMEVKMQAPYKDFLKKWKELLPDFAKYFELDKTSAALDYLTFVLKSDAPRGSIDAIQGILDETVIHSVFPMYNRFFLLPITNPSYSWTQEAYLYALSFTLSSLTRYYPDYWHQEIMQKRKNRWIVRKLNSLIERVYPNLMLNILHGERFKFGYFAF